MYTNPFNKPASQLTDAELDAIIAMEDEKWERGPGRHIENGHTFEEAHALTRETVEEGDDYATTFGLCVPVVRAKRAQRKRQREYFDEMRARWNTVSD